jgi:hypothetical protein
MKPFRRLLFCLFGFAALSAAHAQFTVQVSIKEHLYILHEPLIATVNVTNNTGRDITLSDTPQYQWFGFRIMGAENSMVPPRGVNYHLDPLTVHAGETVRRSVNLNELYELGDLGIYSIKAEIYCSALDKFFSSRPATMELTEGRKLWTQVVGVPEGMKNAGQMHVFTLLAHQRGEGNLLFLRVEDQNDGSVFCTYPIARIVEGAKPEVQFDSSNNFYVLQLIGEKAYVLSKVSVNGKFMGQTNYSAERSRPFLRKLSNGALQLVGGTREDQSAPAPGSGGPAKLSDRPPGFPTGGTGLSSGLR